MEFTYGEKELAHLRTRDPRLGAAIDRIGHVHREVETDLFPSVIHPVPMEPLPAYTCGPLPAGNCRN